MNQGRLTHGAPAHYAATTTSISGPPAPPIAGFFMSGPQEGRRVATGGGTTGYTGKIRRKPNIPCRLIAVVEPEVPSPRGGIAERLLNYQEAIIMAIETPSELPSPVFPIPIATLAELEAKIYRVDSMLQALKHYTRLRDDRHGDPAEIIPLLLDTARDAVGDALTALELAGALEGDREEKALEQGKD